MSAAHWAGLIAALLVAANLLCLAIAFVRLRRKPAESSLLRRRPPVTIVRPVCGLESFSRETLTSGLILDYPDYETIFCVADGQDPIVPLVEELIASHGPERVRLIVGDVAVSANPKLNNCVRGWEAARHDWVILADSNVLMPKDYIQRMLAAWRDDSGLVCSTPAGSRPLCFGAEVDIQCSRKDGEIRFGEGDDWLEILGCGMVHPNVLRNCGLDPDVYQGFAWGMGIDRIAMLKYGMTDLRPFFEADVRWLSHYGFRPLDLPTLTGGLTS